MDQTLSTILMLAAGLYLWKSGMLSNLFSGIGGGSPPNPSAPPNPSVPPATPPAAPTPPPPPAAPSVVVPHETGRVVSRGAADTGPMAGAVYFAAPTGLWWFADAATFTAYGYEFSQVVPASAAELALPVLGTVPPPPSGTSGLGDYNPWNV